MYDRSPFGDQVCIMSGRTLEERKRNTGHVELECLLEIHEAFHREVREIPGGLVVRTPYFHC